jgi:hypothetical protein
MRTVQILSGGAANRRMLDDIWDGHDRYSKAVRPAYEVEFSARREEAAIKEATWIRRSTDEPGLTREEFDRTWPTKYREIEQSFRASSPIMAVLDTGILSHHPQIKDILELAVDLTGGEDPADKNGHGTMCALLQTADLPRARLRTAKVVDDDGFGESSGLIAGLDWLSKMKPTEHEGRVYANLSVGIYSTNWWGRACRGTCNLCKAALQCAAEGVVLCCAVGNEPGKIACPATVSYYREDLLTKDNLMIFGIGAYDFEGGLSNLPIGSGHVSFTPLEPS